jgi:transcriptional regulator with XRE-family HTH domain
MPVRDQFKRTTRNRRAPYPPGHIAYRFGKRIAKLRFQQGWTQDRMATKLGLSRPYLADVERGSLVPHLNMVEVFAAGFRISLSELLEGL